MLASVDPEAVCGNSASGTIPLLLETSAPSNRSLFLSRSCEQLCVESAGVSGKTVFVF